MANSSSRNGTHVIWVTVHTAEGIRTASDLKAFFEHSTNSSAHAVADDSTLLDNLVPYDRAAWTLRNGNSRSDNLELCGFAAWSRDEWITNHQGMLNNAAAWVRARCLARGIPIVHIGPADVKAGRAGVIGHVDYTNGTGDGTHWDPGPGFPWDIVIARAAGTAATPATQEDDMTPDQSAKLDAILNQLTGSTKLGEYPGWAQLDHETVVDALAALPEKVWGELLKTPGWTDPNRTAGAGVIVGNADAHTNAILTAIQELSDRLATLEAKTGA